MSPEKSSEFDSGVTPTRHVHAQHFLFEVAWETCQQVGGIYTVLRTKAPAMRRRLGEQYCLMGPYNPSTSPSEFEEAPIAGPIGEAVKALRDEGIEIYTGYWLITGRPLVVLMNPYSVYSRLPDIKFNLWENHDIGLPGDDDLLNQVAAFGYLVDRFFAECMDRWGDRAPVVVQFHEWMAAAAIPELRRQNRPMSIVFTTHATMLARYLAPHDPWFYDHAPFVSWLDDARRFNIEPQVRIERAAAHGCHTFTTVSDVTGFECETLLGRAPDLLLPNGLNIERFVALHEFQNMHRMYKEQINRFVMGHFFPSYTFDLDKTLYFFSSGRYEYRNKGFDVTLDSLARLNHRLKEAKSDRTVIFFLVTKRPYRTLNSEALRNRAVLEEIDSACQEIKEQIGERLFLATAMGKTPKLDDLMDEHFRLRLRRMRHAWYTDRLPTIVTHDLVDDANDEVLNQLRALDLINRPEDPVKVIYHPDFISFTNPFFGMDYDQFVRGCHLGIFPSAYEPWGYTPLECMARGIPALTSDLSGFGTYLMKHMPDHDNYGMKVVRRRYVSQDFAINEMTDWLYDFVQLGRRDRINQRNQVESRAEHFDWENLVPHYFDAYEMAMARRREIG